MTPDQFLRTFPHASKAAIEANTSDSKPTLIDHLDAMREKAGKIQRRRVMNKTETAYARILEAKKVRGEILRYEFEGIAFRWGGDGEHPPMLYSPDFCVFDAQGLMLIEVKNAFIRSKGVTCFKGCRSDWPEFRWQLWQLKKGEWAQLH